MKTIWKYVLEAQTIQVLQMPRGAKILYAREQGDEVCLWALIDVMAEPESRTIHVYGTGHNVPAEKPLTHLGSAHLNGGTLVFHVFEDWS